MTKSPHRRHVLAMKIEADTKDALIHDIRQALFYIETELPDRDRMDSVTGGIHSGIIIVYNEDSRVTAESYWEEVQEFMKNREKD